MHRTVTLVLSFCTLTTNAQLLDSTFATNGYTQDNALRGPVTSIAVRPDGTIIAGLDQRSYQNWQTGYARTAAFTADGDPITTYGVNGVCSGFAWGENAVVRQVTVMPDDRTLYIGYSDYCVDLVCGFPNMLLGRITAAGVVDSTFGVNGLLKSNELFGPQVMGAWGEQLIRLDDGRILIAGNVYMNGSYRSVFVARIHPDGTVDSSFGPDGTGYIQAAYEAGLECINMAMDGAGNIFVTGQTSTGNLDAYVVKLDTDGEVVTGFGTNGIALISLAERIYPRAIGLRADGRIVLAGQLRNEFGGVQDTVYRAVIIELAPDGTLSPALPGGYRLVPLSLPASEITQLYVMADDRLIVSGTTNTGVLMGTNQYFGFIGRLHEDASWDLTFSGTGDGYVTLDLNASPTWTGTFIHDIVPLPDGRILGAGGRYYQGALQSALLLRIEPYGANVGMAGLLPNSDGPTAFPNPVVNTTTFRFELPGPDRITLSLVDALGRLEHVFMRDFALPAGVHTHRLGIPASLTNGPHLLVVTHESGLRSTVRLMVQR